MSNENQAEPNPWEANDPNNTSLNPKPPPTSSYALQLQKMAIGAVAANIAVSIYYFLAVGRSQEDSSFMPLILLVVYPILALRRGMKPQSSRPRTRPTTERGWWRYYEIVRRSEFVLVIWWGCLNSALMLLSGGLNWHMNTIWFFVLAATPAYIIQAVYRKRLEKSTAHLA